MSRTVRVVEQARRTWSAISFCSVRASLHRAGVRTLQAVLWRVLGTFHLFYVSSLAMLWLLSELFHANFNPYYKSSQAVWHASPILKTRWLGL